MEKRIDSDICFHWGIFFSILCHDEKKRSEEDSSTPAERVTVRVNKDFPLPGEARKGSNKFPLPFGERVRVRVRGKYESIFVQHTKLKYSKL